MACQSGNMVLPVVGIALADRRFLPPASRLRLVVAGRCRVGNGR